MPNSNKLSNLTKRVVPTFVSDDHPNFETFIKYYYEFLERNKGEYDSIANLLLYCDIDSTTNEFLEYFRKEYAQAIPPNAAASLKLLVKNIRQFYRIRGTQEAYDFLFRSVFDSAVEFYYPKNDVIRASDATTLISDDDKIIDSFYWQDFSYVIKSEVSDNAFYTKLIKELVHPAGLKHFTELSLSVDVPVMQGVLLAETLTVLIYVVDNLNLPVTLAESIVTAILQRFSSATAVGHSTGWVIANRENEDVIARSGMVTLGDWDDVPIWQIEGRSGHALSMVFTNNTKVYMNDITIVDNVLTLPARTAGDTTRLWTIPHYERNAVDFYQSDGSTNVNVEYVGTNKNKLLLFVNGKKLRVDEYSLGSPNDVVLNSAPLVGHNIEWYVAEHTYEIIDYIDGTDAYTINRLVGSLSEETMVFVNGECKIELSEYYINKADNIITFKSPLPAGSKIEVVFLKTTHQETWLTPVIENGGNSTASQSTYTITTPPTGDQFFLLSVDGVILRRNIEYTYDHVNTITFTPALDAGKPILIYVYDKKFNEETHSYPNRAGDTQLYLDRYVDVFNILKGAIVEIINI